MREVTISAECQRLAPPRRHPPATAGSPRGGSSPGAACAAARSDGRTARGSLHRRSACAGLIDCCRRACGRFFTRRNSPAALGWLLVCAAGDAAVHHHAHRNSFGADNISRFAKDSPTAVRLRGKLDDEPDRFRPPRHDPLLTVQREATSTGVLEVTAIDGVEGWQPASGKVRLSVEGRLDDVHCGDVVEVTGRLDAARRAVQPRRTRLPVVPARPANYGGFAGEALRRARRAARRGLAGVTRRLARGGSWLGHASD